MSEIKMNDLEALVEKGRELKALLQETPEILSYLKLVNDMSDKKVILSGATDVLLRAGQAAKVLGTDKSTIYRYVREGLLHPRWTPHSQYMKFWLSEVRGLVQEGAVENAV